MQIKILGPGCKKCDRTAERVAAVVKATGVDARIEEVSDMMSVIALSLPEMVILRKVLKPRLIAAFITVVAVGILAVGYLFNAVWT